MDFKHADAAGQTFVYADTGEGPLVVLLHGFPDLPTGWADTQQALNAAGFRTVIPYLRGYHPDTIVAGRGYGGDETAQDVVRLLDAIGAKDAILVGHDWGASIVYRAAEQAPDRVRAIVPVAIPHPRFLKPTPKLAWDARHFVTLRGPTGAWLARRKDFAYIDTLMRRWAPSWSGPGRDATLRDVKVAFGDPLVLAAALAYYADVSRDGMGDLRQPGLMVCGTEDIAPPQMFLDSVAGFDGHAEVLVVDGAGHWPHRERTAEFHERLLAFLGTLG